MSSSAGPTLLSRTLDRVILALGISTANKTMKYLRLDIIFCNTGKVTLVCVVLCCVLPLEGARLEGFRIRRPREEREETVSFFQQSFPVRVQSGCSPQKLEQFYT